MATAAVLAPQAAPTLLMVTATALAALALAYALVTVLRRLRPAGRSACAPEQYVRPPQLLPQYIARIVPEHSGTRVPITPGARTAITTVATERLWARHGVNLHDPASAEAARALLSDRLWHLIRPDPQQPDMQLLHRDLGDVIDELERL